MESIHLKSVDPVSQELLRLAAKNGVDLNWERYGKLQPQDGFLRLGLSCPFGCLQGPCRIDPFGRGPASGLCGLERDAMVAAMLLRICLHGALQLTHDMMLPDRMPAVSFAAALKKPLAKSLKGLGVTSLSTTEIFKGAALLQRPAAAAGRLLEQALVLSLLAVGLMRNSGRKEKDRIRGVEAGYGVMAGADVVIALAGRLPAERVRDLQAAAARKTAAPVRIVSLGDWIPTEGGYLPIACSSAEAELLLSSKTVSFLVAGPGVDPGVMAAARKMEIPVAEVENKAAAAKILQAARQFQRTAPRPEIAFAPDLTGAGELAQITAGWSDKRKHKKKTRVALIGGADSLNYPLGYLAVELANALRGAGLQVAGWGDAAVWMIKSGLASVENNPRVQLLDPGQGPLQVFETPIGNPERLQGICFTGMKGCQDLALALGLALLGCNVAVAEPIPVWGSSPVRTQLSEMVTLNGGRLTCFDHPAEAQELLEWFAA